MRKIFLGSFIKIAALFMICFLLASTNEVQAGKRSTQKHIERYENGKIKVKGFYKNMQKHGNWFYYQSNGMMEKRELWKNGTLITLYIYNDKGRLESVTDKNGKTRYVNTCGCHS